MKKIHLVLLTLVPVVIGFLYNNTLLIPVIGSVLFYLVPCVTLAFWFYLGRQYSKTSRNMITSILIANGIGFLSLLIYIWQFLYQSDSNRNLYLAAFSQMFTSCTNVLTVRIAVLFEAQKNVFTRTTSTAMQILGLALLIIVFAVGYAMGKKHNSKVSKSA